MDDEEITDVASVLEATGRLTLAYLAMRIKSVEDETRSKLGSLERRVAELEVRVDGASRQFASLKREVGRLTAELQELEAEE